ncbi:TRM11 family SAM-dependent methyltransferase [Nanoarchaeota archaeon]
MKRIFLLSGENLELAKAEILALSDNHEAQDIESIENIFILETDFDFRRLALTRKVCNLLFQTTPEKLESDMQSFDWRSIYKKSFSIRITNPNHHPCNFKELDLAKYLWRSVEEPKVDLNHSQTKIELIITKDKILVGHLIAELNHEFNKRRPSTRPARHPTTINPKIARAVVNLTGIQVGSSLTDPFCGSAGILIEAGLMRFKPIGFDIDPDMIDRARKNLTYYNIKRFQLEQADSTRLSVPLEYVATDLPYGMNSKITDNIEKLYADFLKVLEAHLKYNAVLIFPHYVDHKALIKRTRLKLLAEFNLYVHKSLSRNIVLLKR